MLVFSHSHVSFWWVHIFSKETMQPWSYALYHYQSMKRWSCSGAQNHGSRPSWGSWFAYKYMRYLWYISTSNPSEKYISASKLDLFCLPTFKKKTTSTAFKNSIKDHNSYSIYSCPLNVIQKKIRVFLFNDPKIRSARRWDLRFLRWSNSTSRRSWNPVVKKNAPKKQDCHTQSLPPPKKNK